MHALGVALLRAIMHRLGARSDALLRRFILGISAVHLALVRLSRGRLARRLGLQKATIVVLTTTGRRTKLPRDVPLLALPDGENYLVAASQGGLDTSPAWFHNLVADPDAVLDVDGRSHPVRAAILPDEERAATWDRFVRAFPGYLDYQSRTQRLIPLLVLRPVERTLHG